MNDSYDVIVIGGGAAGLSGALTLSRARRSVLVIDAGRPRNAPAGHAHNYLGREGVNPLELLRIGRAEVEGYGGEIRTGEAVKAARTATGFTVQLADGSTVDGRRLLVATGLTDELPDIAGVAERWGVDVLHCPYCHGWEVRDQSIGVIGCTEMSVRQALMWRQWSADITFYPNDVVELDDVQRRQFDARGIRVVAGKISSLDDLDHQAFVVAAKVRSNAEVLAALGLDTAENVAGTYVPADGEATEIPGVWVAGNVTNQAEQLIGAAAAGVRAAGAINMDLITEETEAAVAGLAV
ncbi:NAD(P)/FAD-dependent oxidoreductase [Kutzneria sp. CA-103260]|uniref:NAD(P)/FAD-dependent oxidoreductase n=1 Tax=Kutzneria sp. CA-103260 TaxID=2802641 RepID=UPI001BA650B0|nr:NAD(P)/FAD-dependent oxidoreductase [Kutzneria sp. CA-103260]QUQ63393.1 NAD(P)/FAD-dependent oxidoreductase [Kutzneria sp. CA-103260]